MYISLLYVALLGEVFGDNLDAFRNAGLAGLQMNLWIYRGFVRCRDPGKVWTRDKNKTVKRKGLHTPLISPARAFLYNPLGSRCSTTSSGASTKTSMNSSPPAACNSLATARSARYGEMNAVRQMQDESANNFET